MVLRVKVMHDYQCEPLWVLPDGETLFATEHPRDLGLSPSLVGRLEAWRQWGESRLNLADPHDSRVLVPEEEAAFDAEGRLLAGRVARELPDAVAWYSKDGSDMPGDLDM
jgi:hypothetical protein